jgi:hypothetical protein
MHETKADSLIRLKVAAPIVDNPSSLSAVANDESEEAWWMRQPAVVGAYGYLQLGESLT